MPWAGDEQLLRSGYLKRLPLHERAAKAFSDAVCASLRTIFLEPVAVTHRVKSYESFRRKLDSKEYGDPFHESPDVLGVRVILLRTEEVRRAVEVLSIDFNVIRDEAKGLEPGSGYRSHHLDLRVPEEWTKVPTYRRLHELRFEVQIRTALMHAWAEIEHSVYKPDRPLPEGLQQGFGELAEALRGCDNRLDQLASQLK